MRGRGQSSSTWQDDAYGNGEYYDDGDGAYDDDGGYYEEDERGLVLQKEQSLVNVSSTITQHGVPLLSYTRTMNRFYTSRKQRLSLGLRKCEVCGERIRWLAWVTENGGHTHDGCYERLAWTWTNLYAHQQRLAAEGRLD